MPFNTKVKNWSKKFINIIEEEYKNKTIYPPKNYIYNALELTPFSKVKVVIVEQDPYHGIAIALWHDITKQKNIKKRGL